MANGFSRTGYKVMRSLPHASFTAQARITNCRRSRDFKVSRHSTLAGRSTSNRNPTCADWAERRFFKASGNLQWNNIIYRCGSCHQHKRRRARPAGACCSTVSFRPAIPWWVAPQQSPPPLRRPCHYNSSVRSLLIEYPDQLRLRADHAQDRIYQQILSTRQSKQESGVEMKKRLGERRNTPERKQGRKQEEFVGPFLPP